jgi:hypothetical protein
MNVDPRGFYINEQGVVAPKQTVFNGGKRRKTRRNRKSKKATSRKQRGGATMTVKRAIKKLQDIEKKHGDLEFYRLDKSYLEDIRDIYHSDRGGVDRAILE